MTGFLLRAAWVFLVVGASDVLWARCVSGVARGDRWRSGAYGAGLQLLIAVGVVSYTSDHRMVIPAVAGAFVGTAVGVRAKAGST